MNRITMQNLYAIYTSIRTAHVWVDGYERAALGAYRRTTGEVIHGIILLN